jgi:hypothetical protein
LLSRYVTDDGLLTNPPFPYWLDHAVLDRRGANLLLNGHYLSALKAIQEVYLLLGLQRSPLKPQSIEHLEGSLRTHFWNETMGAFVDAVFDGQQSPKCSEHGQAVMLMHGLVNMRQRDRLLATLRASDDHDRISRTDTGMTLVTPAMLGMLLQGLCHIGELDLAIGMLTERFEPMLANGDNGTLWEEWWLHGTGRGGKFARMNGRSDAQTESAFAPWIFARYVLGLEPRGIGCNEVVIRYLPADRMDRRSGSIPTPLGTFGIQWTKEGRHISCNVSSPSGIRVRLDLASFGDGAVIEHYAGIPRPLIPNDLLDIASGTWTVVLPAEAA